MIVLRGATPPDLILFFLTTNLSRGALPEIGQKTKSQYKTETWSNDFVLCNYKFLTMFVGLDRDIIPRWNRDIFRAWDRQILMVSPRYNDESGNAWAKDLKGRYQICNIVSDLIYFRIIKHCTYQMTKPKSQFFLICLFLHTTIFLSWIKYIECCCILKPCTMLICVPCRVSKSSALAWFDCCRRCLLLIIDPYK